MPMNSITLHRVWRGQTEMSVVLALVVLCGVLMMRTSSRRFAVHPLVLSLFALPVLAQGTAPV
ncbi:MAG: hypothetical protein ACRC52_11560, partial [Aeromonas veronii]